MSASATQGGHKKQRGPVAYSSGRIGTVYADQCHSSLAKLFTVGRDSGRLLCFGRVIMATL